MNSGDIIRIVSKGLQFGQEIINVYYYIVDTVDAGLSIADLLADFGLEVMDKVRAIQTPTVTWLELIGDNLTDGIEFGSIPYALNGLDVTGGASLPSFSAAGFSLLVDTKITRSGSKRYCGIGEGHATDNDYTPSGVVADTLATVLGLPVIAINVGLDTGTFSPVIVGRTVTGSLDLTKINPVTDVVIRPTMTSQNSRKPVT